MKKTQIKRLLSLLVCIVLIAAMALITSGCNDDTNDDLSSSKSSDKASTSSSESESAKVQFTFTVIDTEGNETKFDISTDKETVGDALLEEGLIAGEDSQYGLYVKTVNGLTLDYDTDGKYWAFYVNGQYAPSGVDSTEIVAGETYTFKAE